MDMNRAALLRQPCHFHHSHTFAIDLRRLRQNGANGHHASSANTSDQHVMGAGNLRQNGIGQIRKIQFRGGRFANLRAFDHYKRRAKAIHARKVLVAG